MKTRHVARIKRRANASENQATPKDPIVLCPVEPDSVGRLPATLTSFSGGSDSLALALAKAVNNHIGDNIGKPFELPEEAVVIPSIDEVRELQHNILERTRQWHASLDSAHKDVVPTCVNYHMPGVESIQAWKDNLPQDLPLDVPIETPRPRYNSERHRLANETRYRVWAKQRVLYTFVSVDGPE